ncbi:MAG: response regulator transcription factor [Chloroflexi bacterium]|nr:response regulator transcription factor [Chloroflexota bacterium]
MSGNGGIKVLVVDDHAIVRESIRLVLRKYDDIEVIGEAGEGAQSVELVENLKPDVVLMDMSMPGMGGIEAIKLLRQAHPEVQIIVFTVHESLEYMRRAVSLGVAGYVLKGATCSDLVRSVRVASVHGMYLDPKSTKLLVNEAIRTRSAADGGTCRRDLSLRESEVLAYIGRGQSNEEIGSKLKLSPNTVQVYRSRMMRKLGVHNKTELVRYALHEGLLAEV